MKIQKLLLGLIFALFTLAASAQTATPGVQKRQVKQQKRILKGAKKGDVSKKEFKHLQGQQRRINRTKKRAKSDGKVTKKERVGIHARQNRASKKIRRAKNN
ncbi:MAG: hypothetical protein KTR30_21260 [Saprospiraceae bacterium]|nr:hypothetical protein [Saprospiraceae bacterium]